MPLLRNLSKLCSSGLKIAGYTLALIPYRIGRKLRRAFAGKKHTSFTHHKRYETHGSE